MTGSLAGLRCVPCRGGEPPLSSQEIAGLLPELPDWEVNEVQGVPRLVRVFKFKNFTQALEFTQKVGETAEAEDHHPALLAEWGKVTVSWWTHKIKGLHRNDFIMAAKTDRLYYLKME
jgi:4a-hydroxytetrahydrobiopterin dehydratase